jgi:hypothetical protein
MPSMAAMSSMESMESMLRLPAFEVDKGSGEASVWETRRGRGD